MTDCVVLMFAYHFPPENSIGAARPYRLCKYLRRLGYNVHVITATEQTGGTDPSAQYVPDPFVAGPQRSLGWLMEYSLRRTLAPGAMGTRWALRASTAARKFIRANPAVRTTIFSTFPPLGASFTGFRAARSPGLTWIADFRDPMVGTWGFWEMLNTPQQHFARWAERKVVQSADAVIMNTDTAAEDCRKRYPGLESKIHVLWNGFDPEDRVSPLPLPDRGYRLISHAGELYDGRDVTPLLESVGRLIGSGRISPSRIRIRLAGPAKPDALPALDILQRAVSQGWLELSTEQMPKSEALLLARTSDGLLLVQPQSDLQVPAKLFEYLQIGRPILAYVRSGSPSDRILQQSGVPYRCVYAGSPPQEMDDAILDFFTLPAATVRPSAWFEEQFNAERQTEALDRLIRTLQGQRLS
jgi:hypothetical protein